MIAVEVMRRIETNYEVIEETKSIQELQVKTNEGIQTKLQINVIQQRTLSLSRMNVSITREEQHEKYESIPQDMVIGDKACNLKVLANNQKKKSRGKKDSK